MNEKLLLQDLVTLLAKKSRITQKEADKFLRELFQLILENIYESDIVKIKDFGTFKVIQISSRESVDVNTGAKIEIPSHYKMSFTPDKALKNLVNEPFSHFESVILEEGVDFEDAKEEFFAEAKLYEESLDADIDDIDSEEEDIVGKKDKLLIPTIKPSENKRTTVVDKKPSPAVKKIDLIDKIAEDKLEEDDDDEEIISLDNPVSVRKKYFIEDDFVSPRKKSTSIPESVPEEKKKINKPQAPESLELLETDIPLPVTHEKEKDIDKIPLLDIDDRPKRSFVKENTVTKVEPAKSVIEKKEEKEKPLSSKPQVTQRIEKEEIPVKPSFSRKVEEKIIVEAEKTNIPPIITSDYTAPEADLSNQIIPDDIDDLQTGEDEPADVDYGFVDYERIEKESKWKRRVPWISLGALAAIFAIYQFIQLFNVTYDYEYYINHVPSLSLSDSLPMIDQEIQPAAVVNEVVATDDVVSVGKETQRNTTAKTDPVVSNITGQVMGSNLEALNAKLMSQDSLPVQKAKISDRLQINVVNKAQLYLSSTHK